MEADKSVLEAVGWGKVVGLKFGFMRGITDREGDSLDARGCLG